MGLALFQRFSIIHYEFFEMKAMRSIGPWFPLSLSFLGQVHYIGSFHLSKVKRPFLYYSTLRHEKPPKAKNEISPSIVLSKIL